MKTTLLSLGIIAIAAISVSSCESGKAKVAKMEQISINGKDFRLEIDSGYAVYFHPEGSNGEKGHWFEHRGGPIYVSYFYWVAEAMLPPDSLKDGEKKSLVFNLDLKKIIFETEEDTHIRVFPTEELIVPGGKVYGVIITAYRNTLSPYHRKVYTLDGVLRYDQRKTRNLNLHGGYIDDIVIEGGYIYDASRNGHKPSNKLYKIFPDGSKEYVFNLREPDSENSVSGGTPYDAEIELRRKLHGL
jgi:hypothetical protein